VIGINSLPVVENCRWDVRWHQVPQRNRAHLSEHSSGGIRLLWGEALKMLIFRDKLSLTPTENAEQFSELVVVSFFAQAQIPVCASVCRATRNSDRSERFRCIPVPCCPRTTD
jgi:hypothetical protein